MGARLSMNFIVALSIGVRMPFMNPSTNAVIRTMPLGWRKRNTSQIGGHRAELTNSYTGM